MDARPYLFQSRVHHPHLMVRGVAVATGATQEVVHQTDHLHALVGNAKMIQGQVVNRNERQVKELLRSNR